MDYKTARGHYLRMDIDSGPSRFDTGFGLFFQGRGIKHRLHPAVFTPSSQEEVDAAAERVCEAVFAFQKEMFPRLDARWPQTSDWFISNL